MADEPIQQPEQQPGNGTPPPDSAPEIDYKTEYERLISEHETLKKRQSGSDKKLQAEIDARLAAEKKADEITKSKMSAEEKLEYEQRIQKSKEEQTLQQLKSIERDKTTFEFMIKNKLDYELKDFFKSDNEDGLKDEMEKLNKLIASRVDSEVLKRLNGGTPGKGTPVDMTVENYKKMNLTEQMKYLKDHPAEYEKLKKQGII